MHLSTASLHEYISHRNFIMTEELLVVLREILVIILKEHLDSQKCRVVSTLKKPKEFAL